MIHGARTRLLKLMGAQKSGGKTGQALHLGIHIRKVQETISFITLRQNGSSSRV